MKRTTLVISNIHCPSCVATITDILESFNPVELASKPSELPSDHISTLTSDSATPLQSRLAPAKLIKNIEVSILEGTVKFLRSVEQPVAPIFDEIEASGFNVVRGRSVARKEKPADPVSYQAALAQVRSASSRWSKAAESLWPGHQAKRHKAHRLVCAACRREDEAAQSHSIRPSARSSERTQLESGAVEPMGLRQRRVRSDRQTNEQPESPIRKTTFAIGGMTCIACVQGVRSGFEDAGLGINDVVVSFMPPSATIVHDIREWDTARLKHRIEDSGYDADMVSSVVVDPQSTAKKAAEPVSYIAQFSIGGMTCSSCVGSIDNALKQQLSSHLQELKIDLIGGKATLRVNEQSSIEAARNEIEDLGFEVALSSVIEQGEEAASHLRSQRRELQIRVDGMMCSDCIGKVNKALQDLVEAHPFAELSYEPVEIFDVAEDIESLIRLSYLPQPPAFTIRSIKQAIEALGFKFSIQREDTLQDRAQRSQERERMRILIRLFICFLFAIPTFTIAVLGMTLLPSSNSFRAQLDTPAWGQASRGTLALFALATPVQFGVGQFFYTRAYKSLRGVWRSRRGQVSWKRTAYNRLLRWGSMDTLVALGTSLGYFASVAYMILAITATIDSESDQMGYFDTSVFLMLFILAGRYLESASKHRTGDALAELGQLKPLKGYLYDGQTGSVTGETLADELDVGDLLVVPTGESPPLDCRLISSSPPTSFNEASLTGEARPVLKSPGDDIYAGTTNHGPAAAIAVITKAQGGSALDDIVNVVRDAMGRKASIERIADLVTAYFVPAVVAVATLTFAIWALRGYAGDLPTHWLPPHDRGGWALFAVQFGVAVLVVACPCGIGLAAPTAQMIGVGLCAQHGILPHGGGEAFQAFAHVDTVVLDKTGTLTTGDFTVTDSEIVKQDCLSEDQLVSMLLDVEQASSHPISIGVQRWCKAQAGETPKLTALVESNETAGRGLRARFSRDGQTAELLVGNQDLMKDHHVDCENVSSMLATWASEAKSIILVAYRSNEQPFGLALALAVQDRPREEANHVITTLRKSGVDVWMITGDNKSTAEAVARQVGILPDNVIASARPTDKRDWVERLQDGYSRLPAKRRWFRFDGPAKGKRIVCFGGDGINDSPAIAQADIGLAMGSGSSIAVSTADFCLLNSSLLSILTVRDLSVKTINKIISNLAWASVYNLALMPLAAGAFYEINDRQIRLPPVWASLAMALSSVSVVVNSLTLRWFYRLPKSVHLIGRHMHDARLVQSAVRSNLSAALAALCALLRHLWRGSLGSDRL
ncbi:uncharacterized protein L969DRAFT_100732, partial [Mixia osmundae IAM 14324]|uniref:P-type ATPase A domain-containing protein n=1 Tax=Mixia osmundae (strain CBS 9802 / IAM 14324 / JCM 22182 / KY 12970) TaxID=764103 RepID=G7E075_MIXOS